MTQTKARTVECPRCHGSGNVPQFSHHYGGHCFRCNGSGHVKPPRAPRKATTPVEDDTDTIGEFPEWMMA